MKNAKTNADNRTPIKKDENVKKSNRKPIEGKNYNPTTAVEYSSESTKRKKLSPDNFEHLGSGGAFGASEEVRE